MRKIAIALLAIAASGFTIGAASAADLPIYPSSGVLSGLPSIYSRARNWSGVYIGLNAGGAFGSFDANATLGALSADLGSTNASGFIGGGQVGAQMQYQHFVIGIEGDFQGSTQSHSDTFSVGATPVTVSGKMPWFGTVRGRFGYAVDNILLYGTAGAAFVDGKLTGSALGVTASFENTHTGWTAGGGLEWFFAPQWSAKIEYLYLDSGNIGLTNVGGVTLNGRIKDSIVRGGFNYYFF